MLDPEELFSLGLDMLDPEELWSLGLDVLLEEELWSLELDEVEPMLDPELEPELDPDEDWFEVTSIFSAVACPSTIWYEARTSLPGWMSVDEPGLPSTVMEVESLSLRLMSRSLERTFS